MVGAAVADDVDRASAWEQQVRDFALRDQARRAGFAGKTSADSATHCGACGDAIPAERRDALPGVQLCVVCKERQERQEGMA